MRTIFLTIILLTATLFNCSGQASPNATGEALTSGSRIQFNNLVVSKLLYRNHGGLNFLSGTLRPVKIFNPNVFVWYTSGGENYEPGSVLISNNIGIATKLPSGKIDIAMQLTQ